MTRTRELYLCALASLGVALLQWWPILRDPLSTGFGDWQMIHHNWEAAYVSLTRFHEWPLWDPYHCGGVPILGNPESQLYAPWFWLSLPLGTVLAVKLMLLGHIAIGLSGMYWLAARRYELHTACAVLAAVAWACGACFVWDGAGGHATFLPFAYAPWLSFFVQRAEHTVRDAAWVGALLTLTLFEGGTYPLPYFVLWLGFEWVARAVATGSARRELGFAFVSLGLLALAGAVRFVPIYLVLGEHPRPVANDDALGLTEVLTMLTARSHSWKMADHPFVWAEYGSYIGVPVVLLAAGGIVRSLRRPRRPRLCIGLVLFGSLMLGNWGPWAPFSLLHRLPVYDSLRVPSRFAVFVTFYLALLAARGLDALLFRGELERPRRSLVAGWLVALVVLVDVVSAGWPIAALWRDPRLSDAAPARELYLLAPQHYPDFANFPRRNLGNPGCYAGGMDWEGSTALWVGPSAQVRVSSGHGRVRGWHMTQQTFHTELTLREPARVVFNFNYERGWRSDVGTPVSDQGRLALDLPAGEHQVHLRYWPAEFSASAALSGIGIALLAWLCRRRATE